MDSINLQQGDLELRIFSFEESEELFLLTDRNRDHLRQWLPWVDRVRNQDDSQKFIEESLKKWQQKNGIDLGIHYQNKLAGVIGFHDINPINRRASIGYWLGADFQGHGIMTTACELLITFGFEELHLHRIEIRCAPKNEKSSAIPARLQFKKEGTLRDVEWLYDHFIDHDVYSILASEWQTPSK